MRFKRNFVESSKISFFYVFSFMFYMFFSSCFLFQINFVLSHKMSYGTKRCLSCSSIFVSLLTFSIVCFYDLTVENETLNLRNIYHFFFFAIPNVMIHLLVQKHKRVQVERHYSVLYRFKESMVCISIHTAVMYLTNIKRYKFIAK